MIRQYQFKQVVYFCQHAQDVLKSFFGDLCRRPLFFTFRFYHSGRFLILAFLVNIYDSQIVAKQKL